MLLTRALLTTALPRVLLVGSGGVGTVALYLLWYNRKCEVTSVLRLLYTHVRNHGFDIRSVDYGRVSQFRPHHIAPLVEAAMAQNGPFDYVVVTTKNIPDVEPVEDMIAPAMAATLLGPTTAVLIQNGLDIEPPVVRRFPGHTVLLGVLMVLSTQHHGRVSHTYPEKVLIGYHDNGVDSAEHQQRVAQLFIDLYSTDRNHISYSPLVRTARWAKLVYNASFNLVCALTQLDTGRMVLAGNLETLIKPIMHEVVELARLDGCVLPASTIDDMLRSTDEDDAWYEPLMLVDARNGRPMEVEAILGLGVRVADRVGHPAPTLRLVYQLLRSVQYKVLEDRGVYVLPKQRPASGSYEQFRKP